MIQILSYFGVFIGNFLQILQKWYQCNITLHHMYHIGWHNQARLGRLNLWIIIWSFERNVYLNWQKRGKTELAYSMPRWCQNHAVLIFFANITSKYQPHHHHQNPPGVQGRKFLTTRSVRLNILLEKAALLDP